MSQPRSSCTNGPFGRSSGAVKPPGTRLPQPNWFLIGTRLIVIVALIFVSARAPLLRWADAQPVIPVQFTVRPAPAKPTPAQTTGAAPKGLARLPAIAATLVRGVLRPPGFLITQAIAVVGLTLVALEWLIAAVILAIQVRIMTRQRGVYLRIRTPQETTRSVADTGTDLFRAVHQVLSTENGVLGQAPWLAFTLSGRPDEPTELGVFIAGGNAIRRERWVGAIRKQIAGLSPDAVIDVADDPFAVALQAGRLAVWREFGTALPPSYPLRLHNDRAHSDLLGLLVAAIPPRPGIASTEFQIILRPRARADVDLARGWRAAGMRRLLWLKGKNEYALSPDAHALESKLEDLVYDVLLRGVAIAQDHTHAADALAEIDEITAVLGQYAARSGSRLQRLVRIGSGKVCIPPTPERRSRWVGRGLTIVVGVLATAACVFLLRLWLDAPLHLWIGRWPILTIPAAVLAVLPRLLSILVPILIGLLIALLAQHVRGVSAALRVQRLRVRTPRAAPLPPLIWLGHAWRPPAILGPAELRGLYHLPTSALGKLVRWLPCRYLPAPPHAFANGEPDRLIIGYARHRDGAEAPVGPTFRDGRQALAFTAPPGVGKTRLAANLCDQLRRRGYTLIDGKGDDSGNLVETVRKRIPLEDEVRLVILDVLDAEWPVGLNPLAGIDLTNLGGVDQVLGQVESIFARLDPETWGKAPRMKQYLRKATLLVLEGEDYPALAHVKQALLDPRYRETLLKRCRNIEVQTFWEVEYPQHGEQQRVSRDALISRFDMLLDSELTRYLFNQATPSFAFHEAIAQAWIVLIPLPHRTLGGLAGPVGMLIFQAFMQAAFARPGHDQSRTEYGLICDEFQVLVETGDTKDVRDALTQVRSFGIVTVIANQVLKQLGDLAEYALTAIANRVVLQTQEPDASIYARHYQASGLTAADISGQEPHEHQYARIMCRGTPAGPFSLRPLPWPPECPITVPSYDGPSWQTVLPPGSPTPRFDAAILKLVYGTHDDPQGLALALAAADGAHWTRLLTRWDAVRRYQRQYILAHPGCISDRLERQIWLSRLLAARPRILAMTEYARIRRAVAPDAAQAGWKAADKARRWGPATANDPVTTGEGDEQHAPHQKPHFAVADERPTPAPISMEPDDLVLDDEEG